MQRLEKYKWQKKMKIFTEKDIEVFSNGNFTSRIVSLATHKEWFSYLSKVSSINDIILLEGEGGGHKVSQGEGQGGLRRCDVTSKICETDEKDRMAHLRHVFLRTSWVTRCIFSWRRCGNAWMHVQENSVTWRKGSEGRRTCGAGAEACFFSLPRIF